MKVRPKGDKCSKSLLAGRDISVVGQRRTVEKKMGYIHSLVEVIVYIIYPAS